MIDFLCHFPCHWNDIVILVVKWHLWNVSGCLLYSFKYFNFICNFYGKWSLSPHALNSKKTYKLLTYLPPPFSRGVFNSNPVFFTPPLRVIVRSKVEFWFDWPAGSTLLEMLVLLATKILINYFWVSHYYFKIYIFWIPNCAHPFRIHFFCHVPICHFGLGSSLLRSWTWILLVGSKLSLILLISCNMSWFHPWTIPTG